MNKRRLKKAYIKINYLIGFTGQGPTLLDKKPETRMMPMEKAWVNKHKRLIEDTGEIRKDVFRRACIEVLGEDPEEDWNLN